MSQRVPRVSFAALPAFLAEALRPRVERLGYLGEFFQCAANVPEALLAFQQFTEALKRALPEPITELIALTVATRMQNAYERHQHERLCRRLGYADDWIRAVESLRGDGLSAADGAVQRLVLALLDSDGLGVGAEVDAVIDHLGAAAAVAVVLTVGRYATHSLLVNALELAPPVPSIFADP
jgi:alkylhydroperoxidase family enzyme